MSMYEPIWEVYKMDVYERLYSVVLKVENMEILLSKAVAKELAKELEKGTGKHVFKKIASYEVTVGGKTLILSEPMKNKLAFLLKSIDKNKSISIRKIEYIKKVAECLAEHSGEECAAQYYISQEDAEKLKRKYPELSEKIDEMLEAQENYDYDGEDDDEDDFDDYDCDDCCEDFDEEASEDVVDECCDKCCDDSFDWDDCRKCMHDCIEENKNSTDEEDEEDNKVRIKDNHNESQNNNERVIVAKPGEKIRIIVGS